MIILPLNLKGKLMTTKTPAELYKELAKPFPSQDVSWRMDAMANWDKAKKEPKDSNKPVTALAFPFLDARVVQNRLDDVVGPHRWQSEFREGPGGGILCRISINVGTDEAPNWVHKEDGADKTDVEATKGGLTDAFKRAAVHWGVGRYLYFHTPRWEEVEARGSFVKFKGTPKLPANLLPEGDTGSKNEASSSGAGEDFTPSEPSTAAPAKAKATPAPVAASGDKVYLNVPMAEKDEAKRLGAKWDGAARKWYAPSDADLSQLSRWAEGAAAAPAKVDTPPKDSLDDDLSLEASPEGMTDDEKTRAEQLITKVRNGQATSSLVQTYITTGKGKDQFGDAAKAFIQKQLAALS